MACKQWRFIWTEGFVWMKSAGFLQHSVRIPLQLLYRLLSVLSWSLIDAGLSQDLQCPLNISIPIWGTSGKEPACQCRRLKRGRLNSQGVRFLGWGDPLGGRHGNPLQYSCLENLMDRGAWWATVHRVVKSQTWLKRLSTHTWYCYS